MIIILRGCLVPECHAAGRDHKWEFDQPSLREVDRIEAAVGMDLDQWGEALNSVFKGLSRQARQSVYVLIDILHRREGIIVPFEDIDVRLDQLEFVADPELDESEDDAGKDLALTAPSPRRKAGSPAGSTSGRARKAASSGKSSRTRPTSGAGTG